MNARLPHLFFAGLCAATPVLAQSQTLVINEFTYDDSGTDEREFVELYNKTGQAIDISNWVLASQDENGPNTPYTIPAGTTIPANGYYVLGSSIVPNVNQVVGISNLWENSQESLELYDANGTLIDSLVYEVNKALWPSAAPIQEGQGIWGNHVSVDGTETSWSRVRDGFDTDNNGTDFRVVPETPGTSNDIANILPMVENYDSLTVGNADPRWGSTFAEAFVIDPTVADTNNPNAIAASPAGGNALIFWDRVGGGNANMLLTDASDNFVFEAYVYFDANLELAGEREVWSLGLQGTTSTFFNFPDPSKTAGFTANADTGITLTYEVTDTAATLYFVNNNDGGVDEDVIATIPIIPGTNDGWQRLRIQVGSDLCELFFGGAFGALNGQRFATPIDGSINGIYVGYREAVSDNLTARPFTMDLAFVRNGSATTEVFGTPVPTTTGLPQIGSSTFPTIGDNTFAISFADMPANSTIGYFIGAQAQNPPFDLTQIGAQPGATLYVTTDVSGSVGTNSSGEASIPLGIPNSQALVGTKLFFQGIAIDLGLQFPTPLAHSAALEVTVGS